MSNVYHITHLLRYIEALGNGDAVSLPSREEADAIAAAYNTQHPEAPPCEIEAVGAKWLVYCH